MTATGSGSRYSWLALYAMGRADAGEVPDMFLLRDLRPVSGGGVNGPHTADKEVLTIDQVIAAEGSRACPRPWTASSTTP